MIARAKTFFSLLKETFDDWNKDRAPRLAAALSYYTVFSIAPFLIVVIAIAGLIAGPDAIRGRLDEQIQGLIGPEGADMVQEMIQNVSKPAENVFASIIGIVTLTLGAAGLFGQLQDALNTVWGVAPKPGRGIMGTLKDRFLSFAMVMGIAFLLLVSLVASSVIAGISNWVAGLIPGWNDGMQFVLQLINFVLSFGIITLLFATMYKVLPDAQIKWRDVWIGAAFTALLFTIGKTLLGIYIGNSGALSTYGAAGSLIIILLWIFYSAQILLFGAEFTQVYAMRYGSKIKPSEDAVAVTAEIRANEGLKQTGKATESVPKTAPMKDHIPDGAKPVAYQPPMLSSQPRPAATMPAVMKPATPAPAVTVVEPQPVPPQNWRTMIDPALALFGAFLAFLVGLVLGTQRDTDSSTDTTAQ